MLSPSALPPFTPPASPWGLAGYSFLRPRCGLARWRGVRVSGGLGGGRESGASSCVHFRALTLGALLTLSLNWTLDLGLGFEGACVWMWIVWGIKRSC